MRRIGWTISTLTAFGACIALSACGDARPFVGGSDGGGTGGACTTCHGTAGRTGAVPGYTNYDTNLAAAPPVAPTGQPPQVVGAHQAHLDPAAGSLTGPIACSECHVVPTDIAHASSPPLSPVNFGTGTLARTGGAAAAWNSTDKTTNTTCSNVYCHGTFTYGTVTGTLANAPDWTVTLPPQAACGSCHGLPPTGHIALTAPVTAATCNGCHSGTVDATGKIVVDAAGHSLHINGAKDVLAGSCTTCHGTAGRTGAVPGYTNYDTNLAAAPPVAPTGEPAQVVGAHQAHLDPAAGSFTGPIACSECHVVPTDIAHATTPPALGIVQFGTLAKTGGAAPTWNSTDKTTNTTCSNVYCHGNFTFGNVTGTLANAPDWTVTLPPQAACGSCHGLPPAGHIALSGTPTAATCNGCHPNTVRADGSIIVDATGKSLHVNGQIDEGAHADPTAWANPTVHGYQANSAGLQSCTVCHGNFGPADGNATSSCNGCHGGTSWQSNCTFCHGTVGRTGNLAGTDALLPAAPPVGTGGETAASQAAVGAHQAHVNPPATGALANPFGCVTCHPSPLPTDVAHVVGGTAPVQFSGIATTGGITTANYAGGSCSATYCHGNFGGGTTANQPVWTGGAAQAGCGSCHGTPPATGTPTSGTNNQPKHIFHVVTQGLFCSYCHPGYPASTTPTTVNGPIHVNGIKDVGGTGTLVNSWDPATLTCAPACHGSQTW